MKCCNIFKNLKLIETQQIKKLSNHINDKLPIFSRKKASKNV